jgi:hypothetical protein
MTSSRSHLILPSPNTRKGFKNCHRHFPELLEAVKRGVLAASALPLEFSTISLGEGFLLPAPSPKTLSSDLILEGCAGTNS